ncbi:septum site-determining protein MinC [Legionella sp. CNM-4043-24]|uniref:septum site-determining protein MinC n=1 Tax=Legionella sp. CNM-4043-24 TaxID=3421646 RepID=UPI00403A9D9F
MTEKVMKEQAFKLKGRLYTFTVLQLLATDRSAFIRQLDDIITKAPRLLHNTPVVLDCSAVQDQELDLDGFCQSMRAHNLFPVAVQGASPFLSTLAHANGLAVLHASSTHDKPMLEEPLPELPQHHSVEGHSTKMFTTPIRSGQQVVSKEGDLVIAASVSHGAELLADGNIHVYGALRGRALAGISGDRSARIFCQSLDAELVSIAGFYRLSDAIEPPPGPCQIYLQGEHICIEPIA